MYKLLFKCNIIMKLIGLWLNMAAITAFAYGHHHQYQQQQNHHNHHYQYHAQQQVQHQHQHQQAQQQQQQQQQKQQLQLQYNNIYNESNDNIILIPSDRTVVRYINESLIVLCRSLMADMNIQWMSPKGDIITDQKGRIHIEAGTTADELKLVFMHITLTDKGDWTCIEGNGDDSNNDGDDADSNAINRKAGKMFNLIVYQKITFTENTTIMTVKEDTNATILCEVRGEPQPNITWHYNGQPITIDTNTSKYRILADGLLINTVTQNDTGEYTCRAYQVNSIASDMQERTVLLKIEHKPIWIYQDILKEKYAFINGTVILKCEAIAEPPANFTWYRNNHQLHNDQKHYKIETSNYISLLHIHVTNDDVFSIYKCKVRNHLGTIERIIGLRKGEKPPAPLSIQLRGFNSNTFDIMVNQPRGTIAKTNGHNYYNNDNKNNDYDNDTTANDPLMKINGYRMEYLTELEFKKDLGKWTNAKHKDFAYEEGATFLLSNLEPNTTYLVRAASRNVAGYSDWTKVEKFHTLTLPLTTTHSNAAASNSLQQHYQNNYVYSTFIGILLMIILQQLQYDKSIKGTKTNTWNIFG